MMKKLFAMLLAMMCVFSFAAAEEAAEEEQIEEFFCWHENLSLTETTDTTHTILCNDCGESFTENHYTMCSDPDTGFCYGCGMELEEGNYIKGDHNAWPAFTEEDGAVSHVTFCMDCGETVEVLHTSDPITYQNSEMPGYHYSVCKCGETIDYEPCVNELDVCGICGADLKDLPGQWMTYFNPEGYTALYIEEIAVDEEDDTLWATCAFGNLAADGTPAGGFEESMDVEIAKSCICRKPDGTELKDVTPADMTAWFTAPCYASVTFDENGSLSLIEVVK